MLPIAVIQDSRASNRFGLYLEEILLSEGYNAYESVDLADGQLHGEMLSQWPLVIVGSTVSDLAVWGIIEQYVKKGGSLIAIKPPVDMDYIFGLKRVKTEMYTKAKNCYLLTNRSSHITMPILPDIIQFFGEADLYDVRNATQLNFISGAAERPTTYPGVAVSRYGSGQVAIFTYDLAACIVRMHQGKQDNSSLGSCADAGSDGKYAADDLFNGQLDYRFRLIPQADVHQDLFVRVLRLLLEKKCPIPRLWHFPGGSPAVALINGDSDEMNKEDYDLVLDTINEYGGKYTCYVMDAHHEAVTSEDALASRGRGHEFGPHLFCGLKPSLADMKNEIKGAVESFKSVYGYQPVSHRGHLFIWTGWTEMAEALCEAGIRMDTNFFAGRAMGEGFLNGSALPVKFMAPDGRVIDLYEQSTQMTDDGPFSQKLLLAAQKYDEAVARALEILNICCRYHGVFHHYFHPVNASSRSARSTIPWLEEIMKAVNDTGIPYVNGTEWILFNNGKRGIRFSGYRWKPDEGTLCMNACSQLPVENLAFMLPPGVGRLKIDSLLIDGVRTHLSVTSALEGSLWAIAIINLKAKEEISISVKYKFDKGI